MAQLCPGSSFKVTFNAFRGGPLVAEAAGCVQFHKYSLLLKALNIYLGLKAQAGSGCSSKSTVLEYRERCEAPVGIYRGYEQCGKPFSANEQPGERSG